MVTQVKIRTISYPMLQFLGTQDPTNSDWFYFDWTPRLASGETISTATITVTVLSGTDPSPSAILSGSASISGGVVKQKITGGVSGVTYLLSCAVTTSESSSYPPLQGSIEILNG